MSHIYVPSRGTEDWRRLLRDPVKHWEPGYSAHATAVTWEAASDLPREVRRALEGAGAPALQSLDLLLAIPEHLTAIPGGSSPSHSDVLALLRGNEGLVAMAVEGKAGEDFGETVGDWLRIDTLGRRTAEPSESRLRRLKGIAEGLGIPWPIPEDVRYQLLHRALAALIEARRFGAREAVLAVQAFGDRCEEGFRQYERFLSLFHANAAKDIVRELARLVDVRVWAVWLTTPVPTPTPEPKSGVPRFTHVYIEDGWLSAALGDGRRVQVPLIWYPALAAAPPVARDRWTIRKHGLAVYWPELDLQVSVDDVCWPKRQGLEREGGKAETTSAGEAGPCPGAAGVDGYSDGWVAAVDADAGRTHIRFFESFAELLTEHERANSDLAGPVLLDMPIGLLERGARACDVEARRLIGPRRNSIFTAPIRAVLKARNHADACALGREAEGKAMSQQAFGILPRIAEIDSHMTPARQAKLREGHPEVSFRLLAGAPLAHAKTTPAGREERRALVSRAFPDFETQAAPYIKRRVFIDILDAYALLWSARRVAAGTARTLPATPETDGRGLRVEMLA